MEDNIEIDLDEVVGNLRFVIKLMEKSEKYRDQAKDFGIRLDNVLELLYMDLIESKENVIVNNEFTSLFFPLKNEIVELSKQFLQEFG